MMRYKKDLLNLRSIINQLKPIERKLPVSKTIEPNRPRTREHLNGDPPMLIQFHWQNCKDRDETAMVAQTEITKESDPDHLYEWIGNLINYRKDECPEGWEPMVCDETSEYFWLDFGGKIGPRGTVAEPENT